MDGKHLPWHLPLTDWCIGAMFLFATTGTVILCRFLLRKWQSWRIQRFLDQRAALASPGDPKLTTYDKQVLTKKVRQSGNERLEKSFAFQGNLDLYLAIGLFGLAMVALPMVSINTECHFESPEWNTVVIGELIQSTRWALVHR